MQRRACGCLYDYSYESGGQDCPSGWTTDYFPADPCKEHASAEMSRRAAKALEERARQERSRRHELEQLQKQEQQIQQDSAAALARIARRRYELLHGADRVKVLDDLERVNQEAARLRAQLAKLPPM